MYTVLAFSGLLLVALLVEPLAKRLLLPFSAALVVIGYIGSEVVVALGMDTGLRWHHFTFLILEVFVPVLVFESAFNIHARELFKYLAVVLYLAVPLMLAATFVTAGLVFLGIGHPRGFPWVTALLAGALLSATDPAAVVALFKKVGAPQCLHILVEGESLFNDATAIVLFTLLSSLSSMPGQMVSVVDTIWEFMRVFVGGLLAGGIIGVIGILLMWLFKASVPRGLISLIGALFSVYVGGHLCQVSGVMAALATGLMMGEINRRIGQGEFPENLWSLGAYIANSLLFLLVGVTITVNMFVQQWLAMLIGIGAVLIARALIIYVFLHPLKLLDRVEVTPMSYRAVQFWGGLRGAMTLALALSLSTEVEGWYTVQSIAYGVVLFSLFVQAPTMGWLLSYLRICTR